MSFPIQAITTHTPFLSNNVHNIHFILSLTSEPLKSQFTYSFPLIYVMTKISAGATCIPYRLALETQHGLMMLQADYTVKQQSYCIISVAAS